jgi:hypothetical protein
MRADMRGSNAAGKRNVRHPDCILPAGNCKKRLRRRYFIAAST